MLFEHSSLPHMIITQEENTGRICQRIQARGGAQQLCSVVSAVSSVNIFSSVHSVKTPLLKNIKVLLCCQEDTENCPVSSKILAV